mmetsp:Transcript_60879/g.90262  ORF Transcript_60879/g.90262 Transcript_60879/m.90262 type:complete len:126 (-) Transcript_60879:249-626(-)
MSGSAEQSNAETQPAPMHSNDKTFSAEEAHSKDSDFISSKNSTKETLGESEKSNTSQFSLRNPSMNDEIIQSIIKSVHDTSRSSKNSSTKDWTNNKLRFNAVSLLGRENEITLNGCWHLKHYSKL